MNTRKKEKKKTRIINGSEEENKGDIEENMKRKRIKKK